MPLSSKLFKMPTTFPPATMGAYTTKILAPVSADQSATTAQLGWSISDTLLADADAPMLSSQTATLRLTTTARPNAVVNVISRPVLLGRRSTRRLVSADVLPMSVELITPGVTISAPVSRRVAPSWFVHRTKRSGTPTRVDVYAKMCPSVPTLQS